MNQLEQSILSQEQNEQLQSERAFFDRYIDTQVLAPESTPSRKQAYLALRLSDRIIYDIELDPSDAIENIDAIARDPKQPALAHLAGISALTKLTRQFPQHIDPESYETILTNFNETVFRLDEDNARLFRSVNDAYLHQMVLLAALYNARGLDVPVNEQTRLNSTRLAMVAEILRTKQLRLNMPRALIHSTRSEGVFEAFEGFPETRVICAPYRLAGWEKMEEACAFWGLQLKKDYQLRLPGALVTMETGRKNIISKATEQTIGRTSNLYYVRLPALDAETTEHEEEAEEVISSLEYYLAVQTIRTTSEAINDFTQKPATRLRGGRKKYVEEGIRGVIEYYAGEIVDHVAEDVTKRSRTYDGILTTALRELREETGVEIDPDTVKVQLKDTITSLLLVEEEDERGGYRYRSEEELAQVAINRTLEQLTIHDLTFLAHEFLNHRGERSILTEEQRGYVAYVEDHLRSVVEEIRRAPYLTDEQIQEHEGTLREFLSNIMQIRYETIRDLRGFVELPPDETPKVSEQINSLN